jgi:hypothetical protein
MSASSTKQKQKTKKRKEKEGEKKKRSYSLVHPSPSLPDLLSGIVLNLPSPALGGILKPPLPQN